MSPVDRAMAALVLSTRAEPGDPWWEQQLVRGLRDRDEDRLCWLLRLAEANQASGTGDVFAAAKAKV